MRGEGTEGKKTYVYLSLIEGTHSPLLRHTAFDRLQDVGYDIVMADTKEIRKFRRSSPLLFERRDLWWWTGYAAGAVDACDAVLGTQ